MEPLASRFRPKQLSDFFGQDHILGPQSPLRKLLLSGSWHSLLFWGAPGVGKTTLARLAATMAHSTLHEVSAVSSGVKELREVIEASKVRLRLGDAALTLFVDEIHRLNKSQQDVLLPALEEGSVRFIGATTENPSFEVNRAILSRTLCFRLETLGQDALLALLQMALKAENGEASEEGLLAIVSLAGGDARRALNYLELCLSFKETVTKDLLMRVGLDVPMGHGEHFDLASAMIKSIRASHADAALYYMARFLEVGDDPMFLVRRLIISASEDIGNANPEALSVAVACANGCHIVGFPEARILLSQAITYLAASPKSNRSYQAIGNAIACVKKTGRLPIPSHLLNPVTSFNKELGMGRGYENPHGENSSYRKNSYLPPGLRGQKFYTPSDIGTEKQLKLNLEALRPLGDDL